MHQLFPFAASVIAACFVAPSAAQERGVAGAWSGSIVDEEWAEELSPLVSEAGGLRARVDFGRAPGWSAVRVTLEGAAPASSVCVELGTPGEEGGLGSRTRQVLLADASGRASLDWQGPLPHDLAVRFVARPAGGAALATPLLRLPNGPVLPASAPQRGDVVITEIMKDPSFVTDAHGEWFEIQNVSNHVVNIAGWKLTDLGANSHTILNGVQGIVLVPGQRFVLGIDNDPLTNGGVNVDYKYSNFTLGNGADSILLTSRSGFLVDEVDYDDGILWPDVPGKSITLDPSSHDASSNDDPANWCPAQTMMAGGNTDMGTPGLANDTCP